MIELRIFTHTVVCHVWLADSSQALTMAGEGVTGYWNLGVAVHGVILCTLKPPVAEVYTHR